MLSSPDSQSPVIAAPPPLLPQGGGRPPALRRFLAVLLSLCLGLFVADAVVSLLDDFLILVVGVHLLSAVRGLVGLLAVLMAFAVYCLMGITPLIPKRLFLPVTLFNPLAALGLVPVAIYSYARIEEAAWVISVLQVILGLGILSRVLGGLELRWPLVGDDWLGSRGFNWRNLSGFLLVNVFVLLPAVGLYLVVCAGLAVGHFSEGFLALRPSGLVVRVREYVRNDGKRVRLVPMAHIGEAQFYNRLTRSFPTNSVVLMEGVTDENNLLTNNITYKRMATSLGLAEQHEAFNPVRVEMVMADVDVKEFTADTIGFLNLAMLIHNRGLNLETVLLMLRFSPPPQFEERLWEDLLHKRNRHLLGELQARLPDSKQFVVPWGVAHMPGIAEGIRASGFQLDETRDYWVIRFHFPGGKAKRASQGTGAKGP
jgi:hypothetical protein